MCPIVPTFTCVLLRSNFSFAIGAPYLCQILLNTAELNPPSEFETQVNPAQGSPNGGHFSLRSCRTFPLHLGHDLFGDRARRLFVAREVHGESCAPLRVGAHVGGVAEHFGQRHHCLDYLRSSAMLDALDAAATAAQVADDGAHVLLGHYHFRSEEHTSELQP